MRDAFVALAALFIFFGSIETSEAVDDDLVLAKKPARTLSEYGFFDDVAARKPAARVEAYELNNPLFTDYAIKFRYIYVPEKASKIQYQTKAVLDFPVGTVLIKSFGYPASFANPTEDIRLIETRLLIRKASGWKAYPYVWNEEQTEARLKVAGKRMEVPVTWADGTGSVINYAVPNMNQCKGCHVNAEKEFVPIGPKVRNMNRNGPNGKNQLLHLSTVGFMDGVPDSVGEIPKVPEPFDPNSGSLELRARSYLDGNCAHCHAPGHPADTSGLYLNYEEERKVHWGVNKPPVAAGRGAGGFKVDIKPGHPEQSILLFRMDSLDPGIMMPELGRSTIDKEGVSLIRDFIKSMD